MCERVRDNLYQCFIRKLSFPYNTFVYHVVYKKSTPGRTEQVFSDSLWKGKNIWTYIAIQMKSTNILNCSKANFLKSFLFESAKTHRAMHTFVCNMCNSSLLPLSLESTNAIPHWPTELWPPGCRLPFVCFQSNQVTKKLMRWFLSICPKEFISVIVSLHVSSVSLLRESPFLLDQHPQWLDPGPDYFPVTNFLCSQISNF